MAYGKKRRSTRKSARAGSVRRKSVGRKASSRGGSRQQTVRIVVEAMPNAGSAPVGAMTVPQAAPRKGRF